MLWRFLARHKIAVLMSVAVVGALILMTTSWRSGRGPGGLDRGVMVLATPMLRATAAVADFLDGAGDFFFGWRGLRAQNKMLREEIVSLRQEAESSREQVMAYQRLEDMLDFRRRTGYRMVVAAVIGHDSTNLFKTILLNKGHRDGLEKDLPVVTPDGAVGKIIKVFKDSSQVLLLTDRSSGIDALVQRTRDQGVVQGRGGHMCEMNYLSRQAVVEIGDLVITSGMGGVFPKGVRIGQVTNVKKGGYLLQKVEVWPSASLDRLEEVIVLLDEAPEESP